MKNLNVDKRTNEQGISTEMHMNTRGIKEYNIASLTIFSLGHFKFALVEIFFSFIRVTEFVLFFIFHQVWN